MIKKNKIFYLNLSLAIISIVFIILFIHREYYVFGTSFFLLLFYLYKIITLSKEDKNKSFNKERLKISLFISIIFTAVNVFAIYYTREILNIDNLTMINYIIFIAIPLSVNLTYFLNDFFDYFFSEENEHSAKHYLYQNAKKIAIIQFAITMLIGLFLLCLLNPGVLIMDSYTQLNQALGYAPYTNHHPAFMTFLIRVILDIGKMIGLDNGGILLYSIVQLTFINSIYSYITYFMLRIKTNVLYVFGYILYIILNPSISFFSIAMYKDFVFGAIFILFYINFIKLLLNSQLFYKSKKNVLLFFLIGLLLTLVRNNGIYVFLLTFPFCVYAMRNYRVKTFSLFISVIIVSKLITSVFYSSIGIRAADPREMLSIPMQQIAFISKNADITKKEYESLNKFLDINLSKKVYDFEISDPVKRTFKTYYYNEHKFEFFKSYLKLILKYPKLAVRGFVYQTFRYWTIPNNYHLFYYEYFEPIDPADIYLGKKDEIIRKPLFTMDKNIGNQQWYGKWEEYIRFVPIISDLWSCGLPFWMSIIALIPLYKRYGFIGLLILVPTFIIWLTAFASPVNGEYRYAWPYMLSTIFIYSLLFANKKSIDDYLNKVKI